jgi:hypothetical protein
MEATGGSEVQPDGAGGGNTSRRRALIAVGGVVAVVAFLAWWWWPVLTSDDGLDVLVIGSGDVSASSIALEQRLREQGHVVRVEELDGDWCAAAGTVPGLVRAYEPRLVIIGMRDLGTCAGDPVRETLAALDGVDVIAVAQPGSAATALADAARAEGITLADPARLMGSNSAGEELACQWWDSTWCRDGVVQVRDLAGRLTRAGTERVARVVVAEIP